MHGEPGATLVVGLNPALQKTLVLAGALQLGAVHRATSAHTRAGGKGQGVALAIKALDADARVTLAQLLGRGAGDAAGELVARSVREGGVDELTGWFDGTTRTCTTVLTAATDGEHAGGLIATELIEPSQTVPSAPVDALLERTAAAVASHAVVVLAGTAPPGAGHFPAHLLEQLVRAEGPPHAAAARAAPDSPPAPPPAPPPPPPPRARLPLVVLDGYKEVGALLQTGRVDVLKLNMDELRELASTDDPDAAAEALLGEAGGSAAGVGARRRAWHAAAAAAAGTAPAEASGGVLAVTDGPRPARLYVASAGGGVRSWRLSMPAIRALNAIGAGDVCTGALALQLGSRGFGGADTPEGGAAAVCDAFAWALAAACARCLHARPDELSLEDVWRLRTQTTIAEGSAR